MKKYKRSYNEIWHERKQTIGSLLLLVAVFIAAVMGVRLVLDFVDLSKIRTILDAPAEQHKYENLYNASRYFFRIYYPDDWAAEGGQNGFMENEETGLIAELYPLIYQDPVTPAPDADPEATAIVVFDKVRDPSLTVSFYYREYTEAQQAAADSTAEVSPTLQITASPAPEADGTAAATAEKKMVNLELLDEITRTVYGEYTGSADEGYTFTLPELYETDLYYFQKFTFSYTDQDMIRHTDDVYVVVRASNYLIIRYDARGVFNGNMNPASYSKYSEAFADILNEFRLSVFED